MENVSIGRIGIYVRPNTQFFIIPVLLSLSSIFIHKLNSVSMYYAYCTKKQKLTLKME